MLHPVGWPNHGAQTELYLAEEAIGLVRSLDWNVERGPKWGDFEDEEGESEEEEISGDEGAEEVSDGSSRGDQSTTVK